MATEGWTMDLQPFAGLERSTLTQGELEWAAI